MGSGVSFEEGAHNQSLFRLDMKVNQQILRSVGQVNVIIGSDPQGHIRGHLWVQGIVWVGGGKLIF